MPNKKPKRKRKPSRKPVVWVVEAQSALPPHAWGPYRVSRHWSKDDAEDRAVDLLLYCPGVKFRVRAYERRG